MKRRLFKRIASLIVCVVLLVSTIHSTGTLSVFAEEEETVAVGETWRVMWSAEKKEATALLDIPRAGFYLLEAVGIADRVVIYNVTLDEVVCSIQPMSDNPSIHEIKDDDTYYLTSKNEYALYTYTGSSYGGEVSITVEEQQRTPYMLSSGSDCRIQQNAYTYSFVWFKTTEAGDYCLTIDHEISLSVTAYDINTGAFVTERKNLYDTYSYGRVTSEKIVLTLAENTAYYFRIGTNYRPDRLDCSLSIEKCARDVQNILIDKAWVSIACLHGEFSAACFDYTVAFADGSSELYTYNQLKDSGILPPEVYCLGDRVTTASGEYYCAGIQPVMANYNGTLSFSEIEILPFGQEITLHNKNNPIILSEDVDYWHCFRLKVETTGVYSIFADRTDVFEYLEYDVTDENNYPVYYNEKIGGFPLVGGHSYTLHVSCAVTKQVRLWHDQVGANLFPDTHPKGWYFDAATYAVGRGIMTGYKNGLFGTSDSIQRQDFLVMLARYDGVDLSVYADVHGLFSDVAQNSYYEAAVTWGYANGIVTGYQNGAFGVGDRITREQMATFLYRYAQYRYRDVTCEDSAMQDIGRKYVDFSRVSDFAEDAVVWAIERGIIKGKTQTTIVPQGYAQRCEVAQMMYNIFANDAM